MKQHQPKKQSGFTILELMIATVIVSIILLLVTSVMISLQNLYYKGVNQESVQNDVRNITDQVSQEIQDTNATEGTAVQTASLPYSVTVNGVTSHEMATCIGSVQYLYVIGPEVGTATKQAMWRDSTPGSGCGKTAPNIITTDPSDGGTEYVASGARLTDFQINPPTPGDSNYAIYVSVAIGNDNVINLNNNATNNDYGAACIDASGNQFCATASLQTEVGQRLQ